MKKCTKEEEKMEHSTSREEIKNAIQKVDDKIAELRQADDGIVDFVTIGQLEREKEKLEHALEEIAIETAQNSGTDFEQAKQNEEMSHEEQEQEIVQREDEKKEEINIQDEKPKPLSYWEYQSGVVIIPYDGSRTALSNKEMTRDEYVKQLSESVTIIRSPGMAEAFFQNRPDDWEKLRNPKEEFQKTIIKYGNDLPIDLDTTQAYVLYQTDEDTVHEAKLETKKEDKEVIDNDIEDSPQTKRNVEILKKHIASTPQKAVSVLIASEALKQAEKGTLKEEELNSVTETVEKKEEVMQEERQEESEVQEGDTLGEAFVKNVLADSIDNAEMVEDATKSALDSVSQQIRDAIENGIENEEIEKEEEELLPGMDPKI